MVRLVARLGFREEGRFREVCVVDGRPYQQVAGRRRKHLIDEESHSSRRHEAGATRGDLPHPLRRGVVRGHLGTDLGPMSGSKVDRRADVAWVQVELLRQDDDPLFLTTGRVPQCGHDLPYVRPDSKRSSATARAPAIHDARVVERVQAFPDEALQ